MWPHRREGVVVTRYQHPFLGRHVERPPPRRPRHIGILIEHRRPVGIAHEQQRVVGDVRQIQHALVVGLDREGAVARRVAIGGDRLDAGDQFLARLIARHLVGDRAEYPADALEPGLHPFGRLGHVVIIHPERPFRRRHHDLGIGVGQRAVLAAQAIDVVAVEVADDDDVDRLRVDPGGGEVGDKLAGGWGPELAVARIQQHQFGTSVDHEGSKRDGHLVRGQERVLQRLLHIGERGVADKAVGEGAIGDAVGGGGDLEAAELHAVDAGRLAGAGGLRSGGFGQRRAGQWRVGRRRW